MRRALLCAMAALAAAPAAQAAYAPRLEVTVGPPTPATPASLTATVTQAPGEDATASERVRFPPQFTFNSGLRVGRCTAEQEHAARCPDDSRIGMARTRTILGDFAGPVYLTSDFRFAAFLRGLGGLVEQEIAGHLELLPDGSVESVLEGLPDVPATLARVAFDGGSRSLFLTPRACGTYTVGATFTGHGGGRVERTAAIGIAGCDSVPHFRRAAAAAGRRRVRLAWALDDAGASTMVDVRREISDGRLVRLVRVGARARAAARAGANRLSFGPLRPGRYEAVLTVMSVRGRPSDVAHVSFAIAR
jgi:hypothetical protein